MAIDYWTLSKDFKIGDYIQKFMPGHSELSPYIGRVTAVMPGIGFIDVQWPFGNERVSPEDVVKTEKEVWWEPVGLHSNPSYYPGLDAQPKTAALAKNLWNRDLPVGFHLELARVFHKGASSVQAYDHLWHHYREADDEALREEVNKFYRLAYNSVTALIVQEARKKDAAYWAATDRKYRATKTELSSKRVSCPKCKKANLRKATYKMEGGQRMKLLACPQCMHLVKQTDVLGPGGEAVEW